MNAIKWEWHLVMVCLAIQLAGCVKVQIWWKRLLGGGKKRLRRIMRKGISRRGFENFEKQIVSKIGQIVSQSDQFFKKKTVV